MNDFRTRFGGRTWIVSGWLAASGAGLLLCSGLAHAYEGWQGQGSNARPSLVQAPALPGDVGAAPVTPSPAPALESYVTDSGRTVKQSPGNAPSKLDSYVTNSGRTVLRVPGSPAPKLDDSALAAPAATPAPLAASTDAPAESTFASTPLASYTTPSGRTVLLMPGASVPTLDSYVTSGGRTVLLMPGAELPQHQSYVTEDGRTVLRAR